MLSYFSRQKTAANKWEHSSAGRASALQAEGHRFEPYCSHHYGLVVQLVRTLACHARGRRFDPDPGRQFASVAQSVEQGTENPRVIGSIPIGGTTSKILSFIGKSCKQDFCDEYQIFSFSPQNLASQAFAGPRYSQESLGRVQGQMHRICGRSSSGRAPPCQGGGSEFEPRRPLH